VRIAATVISLLVASSLVASSVAAADGTVVSGSLQPVELNPAAAGTGHGVAVLTIAADRTAMTYRITYRGVGRAITAVHFCAGSNPREFPIPITCAFAIPQVAGGASPITGKTTLVPAQADVLLSGFAVVELASSAGAELSGYVAIGAPPPDTATAPAPARPNPAGNALLLIVAVAVLLVLLVARVFAHVRR